MRKLSKIFSYNNSHFKIYNIELYGNFFYENSYHTSSTFKSLCENLKWSLGNSKCEILSFSNSEIIRAKFSYENCQMSNGENCLHAKFSNCHSEIVKCQMGKFSYEIVKWEMRKLYHKRIYWEMTKSVISQILMRKIEWKLSMGKFSLEILKFKFRNYKSKILIEKCQMGKFVIICKILICEIVILKFRNYKSKFSLEIVIL